jgi:tetratricopeptide (TPR) repeat protein
VQHNIPQARADWEKALKLPRRNAYMSKTIAWLQATCPEDSFRNGKAAVEAARRACDLTQWKDYDLINTLAAAYAEAGDFDRAIAQYTRYCDRVGRWLPFTVG